MPIAVDVNLRIPNVKEPATDASGDPIISAEVRFIRDVRVPAIPPPGTVLQLDTKDGPALACEVRRADWSERQDRFIVYCQYAKRSIPREEYHALLHDPDWEMRPLL